MSTSPQPKRPSDDDVRAIPLWADRYARNQPLPRVAAVVHAVVAVVAFVTAVSASLVVAGLRAGSAKQSGLFIAAAAVPLAGLAWLVFTRRLQAAVQTVYDALVRGEGHVVASASPASPEARRRGQSLFAWIPAFLVVMTPVIAQHLGVPMRYVQPVVAAYLVPALLVVHTRRGVIGGPLMLLWPGLYALHALLVLAGVRLPAVQEPMMNALVPLWLYLTVAMVSSRLYGRFALRKLRRLAHSPAVDDDTGGESHE